MIPVNAASQKCNKALSPLILLNKYLMNPPYSALRQKLPQAGMAGISPLDLV
jgi:hypothetical protein